MPTQEGPTILVVDDERAIADTLVLILKKEGFAASAAYNGKSALEQALTLKPALVITDVAMPGMNGIELAISLKATNLGCQLLLFSGHATTHELLEAAKEQGHEFNILAKPIHPIQLLAHLQELGFHSQRASRHQE